MAGMCSLGGVSGPSCDRLGHSPHLSLTHGTDMVSIDMLYGVDFG
jgi:hypothetical protein